MVQCKRKQRAKQEMSHFEKKGHFPPFPSFVHQIPLFLTFSLFFFLFSKVTVGSSNKQKKDIHTKSKASTFSNAHFKFKYFPLFSKASDFSQCYHPTTHFTLNLFLVFIFPTLLILINIFNFDLF